jgi:acetyl esterase/lipase
MILTSICTSDILIFLLFLIPQLLIFVPPYILVSTLIFAVPNLLFRIPYQLVHERYYTPLASRSPYVQQCSLFQDVVVRCVRYAFGSMPASVGRVFFSKPVALPFMRWRMFRHGYTSSPIHYEEVLISVDHTTFSNDASNIDHNTPQQVRGIWMIADPSQPPDVVVYYLHGGGFSMGSAYFYLEFLLAWLHLLKTHATRPARNPAILALDYTLVPFETYPTQLCEVLSGYRWLLAKMRKGTDETEEDVARKVCLSGDSAGATLSLSLLLELAFAASTTGADEEAPLPAPGYTTLISPWPTLVSSLHEATSSDYLAPKSLHHYARQYVGDVTDEGEDLNPIVSLEPLKTKDRASYLHDPVASPGANKSGNVALWARAWPEKGLHFIFGAEECLGEDARELIRFLLEEVGESVKGKGGVTVTEEEAQVHAWPVVQLFLGNTEDDRLKGLRRIVDVMVQAMVKPETVAGIEASGNDSQKTLQTNGGTRRRKE